MKWTKEERDKLRERAATNKSRRPWRIIWSLLDALDERDKAEQFCPYDCDHCHDEDCECENCEGSRQRVQDDEADDGMAAVLMTLSQLSN